MQFSLENGKSFDAVAVRKMFGALQICHAYYLKQLTSHADCHKQELKQMQRTFTVQTGLAHTISKNAANKFARLTMRNTYKQMLICQYGQGKSLNNCVCNKPYAY